MAESLANLASRVIEVCRASNLRLVLAESLTGGLASSALVAVPGASEVLLAGVVAYHDAAKHQLLGVPTITLTTFGAVSAQTAQAMALGARTRLTAIPGITQSKVIGLATTGVAGPDLQEGKPVGRVHLGIATDDGASSLDLSLYGSRDEIREQACVSLFEFLLQELAN